MPDLSRIGEREKLKSKAGDEPHWQRLRQGVYLGYRPSRKQAGGTWFARFYDADANRNARKRLGDYGTLSGHDVFKQAKADAEAWAETVETGGERARDMETVKDACEAYLEQRPGSIAEGVFRRHVYSDPIAKVKLDKLRRHHLKAWRKRLEQAPALVTRTKDAEKKRMKPRSQSTVNRDMVPLRAALGMVLKPGAPNTDAAWQEALRPFKGADKRRELYIDRDERKALIDATCEDAARIGRVSAAIIDRLRKHLGQWRDDQAARIFAERLESGQIEFRIRGDGGDWIMPTELFAIAAENADLLTRSSGTALERSLFLPIFKHELNGEEQGLARKLDESAMIRWWHRNGTVRGDYALRGWRRGKVYPDFVFAAIKDGDGQRLVALESKGDQLDNRDTAYKAKVLAMLTDAYAKRASATGDGLELKSEAPDYQAAVVLFSDMDAHLPGLIQPDTAKQA